MTASSFYPQPEDLIPSMGSSDVVVVTSKRKMQHGARTRVQPNDSTMEMPERWGPERTRQWMKRGVHSGPHLPSISVCAVLNWAPVLAPCFMVSCPNSPTEGDMWMKTALMNPTHNDSFIIFPNSPSSRGPHRDPGPSL